MTDRIHKTFDWTILSSHISNEASDPLLGALLLITQYYGRPSTIPALRNGLPLQNGRLTPELFSRAAQRANLNARINAREIDQIPDYVLPVILLLKDGDACILLDKHSDTNSIYVTVSFPNAGGGTEKIKWEKIESSYTGYCIFIKPEFRPFSRNF